MTRYPALIDGESGACGVTFPEWMTRRIAQDGG